MSRVLVTGWSGYIGPVLVRRLREAGHYVIGWDTGWFLPNFVEPPTWPDMVRFVDIRDAHLWPDRVDAVVHLAGLSNDPMGALDPDLTREINADATVALIRQMPTARHLVFSSCSVYGMAGVATEESEPNPLTTYAMGKWAVDHFLHGKGSEGRNAVSLRLGTVYGFSPGHRLDLVVNRMVWDALNLCLITTTGNAARPLVHVEDVADAVLFMLDRPEAGIYNVVGENVRMHDLAQTVSDYFDEYADLDIPIRSHPSADARDYMASGDKLAALGWTAKRTVAGSLPRLVNRTNLISPLTDRLEGLFLERTVECARERYERLSALKQLLESGYLTSDLRPKERIAA